QHRRHETQTTGQSVCGAILLRSDAVGDADMPTEEGEPIAAFVAQHPLAVHVDVEVPVPAVAIRPAERADGSLVDGRQAPEDTPVAAPAHPPYHHAPSAQAVRHRSR